MDEYIIGLLKDACTCFQLTDWRGYEENLAKAKEEIDIRPARGAEYGEWVLVSALADIGNVPLLCEKYKEAARYIGGRSKVLPLRASMLGGAYNPFANSNLVPGHADENTDKLREAATLFSHLTGGGGGTDICCRAQLAFYRGDLGSARRLALEAFEAAQSNEQELVALCAIELLAQIAKHKLDAGLWRFAFAYIESISDGTRPAARACREQAQAISAILTLSVGILKMLPAWIEQNDYGAISCGSGYRVIGDKISCGTLANAMIAQISYYSYKGEPVKSLNLADMLQRVYRIDNVVTNAYLEFFRAGCYAQLQDTQQMCAAIGRAMEQIVPDRLYLIAAEFEPAFGTAIYAAAGKLDKDAPEIIKRIGGGFWEKLAPFREEIIKKAPQGFTKREAEIIPLLGAGLNNAEIAAALFIAEGTAKRHVANIYEKLHISRKTQMPAAMRNAGFAETAFWTSRKS